MKFSPDTNAQNQAPQHHEVVPVPEAQLSQKREIKLQGDLPIDKVKVQLLETIDTSPSTILVGETGSGKTTRTPLFLLEKYPDKKIAVTSPRVFPARSISRHVASSWGGAVGEEVGLITRNEKMVSKDTRLTFMTDGVLLNMLRNDETLSNLDIVMVDEAHERTINIDLLLGLLKRAQKLRKEKGLSPLKIIVASATIEEAKFTEYFDEAPVEKVLGRMYPVETQYCPPGVDPYSLKVRSVTEEAAHIAKNILDNKRKEGDVLIFMPGEAEITKTIEHLRNLIPESEALILPLYGAISPKDQDLVFDPSEKRKIIVATNIAETSVTIDGVRHVIDAGLVKEMVYHPSTGINALEIKNASQANMNQRAGRGGRTAPGDCYRIMSQVDFESRPSFQKPELLRSDLGEVVLRMKDMGIDDVENFDFIDKPERATIHAAVEQLTTLGALDERGKITDIGREMQGLQLRPDLARMMIEAKHLGTVSHMVTFCAMLASGKDVFYRPRTNSPNEAQNRMNLEKAKNQDTLRVQGSDVQTLLHVHHEWLASGKSKAFVFDHLLNQNVLQEAELVRMQLLRSLGDSGVSIEEGEFDVSNVLKCILAGAPDALFYGDERRRYYKPIDRNSFLRDVQIFPGSSSFNDGDLLMIALKVGKSEKTVTDRYGFEEKKVATYARVCHQLSIEEAKKVLGDDAITETPVGPPRASYGSSDTVYQTYETKVRGVTVEVKEKAIKILERGVQMWLPDIHYDNTRTLAAYEDLRSRSWGELPKIDLESGYKMVIESLGLSSREDIIEHEDAFRVTLEDLVSEEKQKEIRNNSPVGIHVGGMTHIVEYVAHQSTGGTDVHIHVRNEDAVQALNGNVVDAFPKARRIRYMYRYRDFSSPEEIQDYIVSERAALADAIARQRERFAQSQRDFERKRQEEELRHMPSTADDLLENFGNGQSRGGDSNVSRGHIPAPRLRVKEVKIEVSPEEKITLWKDDIEIMKGLLTQLKNSVDQKTETEFKDKSKVLERIKELRTEINSLSRSLEEGYSVFLEGRVTKYMQDFKALVKRTKVEQGEMLLISVRDIVKALKNAALRNDVEIEDAFLAKVMQKAYQVAQEGKETLTDDQADEILIDMV